MSGLAIRSKAYWGYSSEFMTLCVEELSVSRADIGNCDVHYVIAEIDEYIVGFYSLEGLSGIEIELGALFVDPGYICKSVGKPLIEKAKTHAVKLGSVKLNIQGNSIAEKFYRASGGKLTGTGESENISGRFLPAFQISLSIEEIG